MSILFSPQNEPNITIKTKRGVKILISLILWKKNYLLTGVTLKFYQKYNFSPKNNLFTIFFQENITQKIQKINCFWTKHVLTYFITFFY